MPIIHIYAKDNKSTAQKRAMARDITAAVVAHSDAVAEQVQIFWHDIKAENYARGGVLSSDRRRPKKPYSSPSPKPLSTSDDTQVLI